MAALAKDRNTPRREGDVISVGVKAATKIYAGSLVARAGTGYAVPGSEAATLVALGRAEALADNSSGASGDIQVTVRRGTFRWENSAGGDKIGKGDIGNDCYIVDDETVAKTHNGNARSKAGKILGVDAEGVWVETR